MNRIVLIGNGFDLAHGLETGYPDFIKWYLGERVLALWTSHETASTDILCELKLKSESHFNDWFDFFWQNQISLQNKTGWEIYQLMIDQKVMGKKPKGLFNPILKNMDDKGWVDVENEYYNQLKSIILHNEYSDTIKIKKVKELNEQLSFIQSKLIEFLNTKNFPEKANIALEKILYDPILEKEIAVSRINEFYDHVDEWVLADDLKWELRYDQYDYNKNSFAYRSMDKLDIEEIKNKVSSKQYSEADAHKERVKLALEHGKLPKVQLPNNILFVNFNYTPVADLYVKPGHDEFKCVPIHGVLEHPETIIFGYGDDLDKEYRDIQDKNENTFMDYFKTNMYMEEDNYRQVLQFAESEPYQIYIIGHSCGNSDRTLLNTLFEHDNCVSIKPFYYKKSEKEDTYRELQINIARNFKDSKKMRERVVNKANTQTYCDDSNKD